MARERIVKYPPKRGKLTKRQVERAVKKVIRERLEREALEDYLEYCRKAREEYEKNPPPGVIRLRKILAERRKTSDSSHMDIPKDSSAITTPSPSKNEQE